MRYLVPLQNQIDLCLHVPWKHAQLLKGCVSCRFITLKKTPVTCHWIACSQSTCMNVAGSGHKTDGVNDEQQAVSASSGEKVLHPTTHTCLSHFCLNAASSASEFPSMAIHAPSNCTASDVLVCHMGSLSPVSVCRAMGSNSNSPGSSRCGSPSGVKLHWKMEQQPFCGFRAPPVASANLFHRLEFICMSLQRSSDVASSSTASDLCCVINKGIHTCGDFLASIWVANCPSLGSAVACTNETATDDNPMWSRVSCSLTRSTPWEVFGVLVASFQHAKLVLQEVLQFLVDLCMQSQVLWMGMLLLKV